MDLADWRRRWEQNLIGFHEPKPNELLVQHLDLLRTKKRVLVPLSGKSVDMLALAAAGHDVVGVEGASLACDAFFRENGFAYARKGDRFRSDDVSVEIECANFFDMTRDRIGAFDAAWDRAAFIAIEKHDRGRYVDVVRALLRPGGRVLLATFAYDQRKVDGPPWSVDRDDVRAIFLPRGFAMEPLAARRVSTSQRLRDAGVVDALEELLLLTRID